MFSRARSCKIGHILRAFLKALAALGGLAMVGCGGAVVAPSDGGAGALCPARVVNGEACGAAPRTCLGSDQCNDCYCTAGVWICDTQVCVGDAGLCPTARPRTGDLCDAARQVCSYGSGCTFARCVCAGGRFTCDLASCPDR